MISTTPAISAAVPASSTNSRISMALPGLLGLGGAHGRRCLQTYCEHGSQRERNPDAGDASGPAEAIEELAEHCRADEPAEEVAGEVDPARRAAVDRCRAAHEAGRGRLREERPHGDEHHADD